jgi:hypothetical protein
MSRRLLQSVTAGAAIAILVLSAGPALAQDGAKPAQEQTKPAMDIYGFAMLDIGQNFTQIDPNWFDTMKITKLPSFTDQFGKDNSTFAGVRQSRFGVKGYMPTALGELKTRFEFDMFGVGADAGQTTIRLRYAWGEVGKFGAGQTDSPFEDDSLWPNTLEYWGPTGMVYFRNVQFRWTPLSGEKTLMFAIERPGASGDQGVYADRIELDDIKARFPLPDFTGAFKYSKKWGYVRVGWALREIKWDDMLQDQFDLSGRATGWGVNLSSSLNLGKNDVLHLQVVYGRGIQNYMQDSPVDIGIENNLSDPVKPIVGKALPIVGTMVFLDHSWNERWTSSFGYSNQTNSNTDAQAPDAFHAGHYALGNVLFSPVPNVLVGGEFQWGRRVNNSDGFSSDGVKVQFSFKYNFSYRLGG